MLSIYTLTALSFQRWVVVTKPDWVDVQSLRATLGLLAAVWASALAVAAPPLTGTRYATFVPESAGITCSTSWESPESFW